MRNKAIRQAMERYKIKQWELADLLGINETSFCKKLRYELPEEEQNRIIEAIRQYLEGGQHNDK